MQALHSTDGPMPWAINRVLEKGATAPRVILFLSCGVASLMLLNPALVVFYSQQLQKILLYGSGRLDTGGLIMQWLTLLKSTMKNSWCNYYST